KVPPREDLPSDWDGMRERMRFLGRVGTRSHRYAVPLDPTIRWESRPPSISVWCRLREPAPASRNEVRERKERTTDSPKKRKRTGHGEVRLLTTGGLISVRRPMDAVTT